MTAFFMAWMMFCYIPCPVQKWDDSKKQEMLVCFPFIGLMIGAINFAVFSLTEYLEIRYIEAALLTFLPWMLCGFIHQDGFMDCADAVLSCRDEKKRLEILKDPHVGSFAVISILILAMLSFGAWTECFDTVSGAVIILIPAVTRACAALCVLCFKPLETSSYVPLHKEGIKKKCVIALSFILAVFTAAAFLLCGIQGFAVLYAALSCFLCVLRVGKNLGGMSGDVSGCAICISELAGVILLCFL